MLHADLTQMKYIDVKKIPNDTPQKIELPTHCFTLQKVQKVLCRGIMYYCMQQQITTKRNCDMVGLEQCGAPYIRSLHSMVYQVNVTSNICTG